MQRAVLQSTLVPLSVLSLGYDTQAQTEYWGVWEAPQLQYITQVRLLSQLQKRAGLYVLFVPNLNNCDPDPAVIKDAVIKDVLPSGPCFPSKLPTVFDCSLTPA